MHATSSFYLYNLASQLAFRTTLSIAHLDEKTLAALSPAEQSLDNGFSVKDRNKDDSATLAIFSSPDDSGLCFKASGHAEQIARLRELDGEFIGTGEENTCMIQIPHDNISADDSTLAATIALWFSVMHDVPDGYTPKLEKVKTGTVPIAVMDRGAWYQETPFLNWLNNPENRAMMHHLTGEDATSWSDVMVEVNPQLSGDENNYDMPDKYWREVVQAAALAVNYRTRGQVESIRVLIRNFK